MRVHRKKIQIAEVFPMLACSPQGDMLAGRHGAADQVELWATLSLSQARSVGAPPAPTRALTFGSNGRLYMADSQGFLHVWERGEENFATWGRWPGRHISGLSCRPGTEELAVAQVDGTIQWLELRRTRRNDRFPISGHARGQLAYSSDGKMIALLCRPNGFQILDAATGQVRARIELNSVEMGHVAFLLTRSDGKEPLVASLSIWDGDVYLWELPGGKLVRRLPGPGCEAVSLAISPQGALVAVGATDHRVHIFDLPTGQSRGTVNHKGKGYVRALAFSPDGRTLVSAGADSFLRFWDMSATPPVERASRGVSAFVQSAVFLPDGETLVTLNSDGQVHIWRYDRRGQVTAHPARLPHANIRGLVDLHLAPNGRRLFATGNNTRVCCWDLPSRSRLFELGESGTFGALPLRVACAPDGRHLAVTYRDGSLRIWDLNRWEYRRPPGQPLGDVHSLAFTPDSRTLIIGNDFFEQRIYNYLTIGRQVIFKRPPLVSTRDRIRSWDIIRGAEFSELPDTLTLFPPSLMSLSRDGRTLAAGSVDGSVRVFDRTQGKELRRLFVSEEAQKYVGMFEGIAIRVAPSWPEYPEGTQTLAFSPSGRWLLTLGTKGHVKVWDTSSWQEQWAVPEEEAKFSWAGFAPDDSLAIACGGQMAFWDVARKEKRQELGERSASPIVCAAFAENGSVLAAADMNRRIQLWDLRAGEARSLIGHSETIHALAFSPDGRTLASAGDEGSIRLWSVSAAQEVADLLGDGGPIHALAFSPDGSVLASGSGGSGDSGGSVLLWRF
jgi:WD40 repeat protein